MDGIKMRAVSYINQNQIHPFKIATRNLRPQAVLISFLQDGKKKPYKKFSAESVTISRTSLWSSSIK